MDVFTFDKSVMERYEDCCMALKFSDNVVSAAKIHSAWQYYLSLLCEPAGWTSLWRLSRGLCEELQIRYPTVVYGTVEQVDFKECRAQFKVEAVQDEDVNLVTDTHYVNLEELFPTTRQENDALNVKQTAEALDNYRFFLNNIWQPWDAEYDDECLDFIDTHFLTRAQLYCDMKNKRMSRNSIAHCKMLINEAREISLKRDRLESEFLSDDEGEDDDSMMDAVKGKGAENKDKKELLRLNIRMNQIKTEFEILENPKMRQVYEESQQELVDGKTVLHVHNVIVTKPGTVQDQLEYLTAVKAVLGKDENTVVRSSLQDALLNGKASDLIFIPHGVQFVNFPLSMEDGGCIKAIQDKDLKSIIARKDEDQHLFVCGNYQFENLTLDCRNVDIGILVRPAATVKLTNCVIVGGKQASTNQGICVRESGKLILENCRFEDNSTGISVRKGSEVFAKGCIFSNCTTGIDVSDSCQLTLEDVSFTHEEGKFGLIMKTNKLPGNEKKGIYKNFKDLPNLPGLHLIGTNKGAVCLVKEFIDDAHVILD